MSLKNLISNLSAMLLPARKNAFLHEKQESAMQHAMDGMALLDAAGRYTFLNKAHAAIYGYSGSAELVGKSWKQLYGAAELERFDKEIMPGLRRTGFWRGETVGQKKDGTSFDQELTLSALPDGGLICVVRDITGNKRIQEEIRNSGRILRETKEQYEKLLYMSPDSIVLTDLKFKILLANKKTAEFIGLPLPENMTGTSALKYVQPEDISKVMAYGLTVLSKGELKNISLIMKREKGELFPVEMSVALFRDAANAPAGYIVVTRDITERRLAEAKLRETEEQFRLLVENAPYAIYVQLDRKFAYLNSAALTLFGAKSPEELLGKDMLTRFHPDFHEIISKRVDALNLEELEVPMLEEKYLRMDGSVFDVIVSAVPFEQGGRHGAIVFFRDITEKKRQEAEVLNTQKIESLGVMAGGIAHDFNNMLTGITANLSLIESLYAKTPEAKEIISETLAAAANAQALTHQLLTFAKGGKPLKKVMDLRRPLADSANFAVRGSRCRCEVAVAQDLACVNADEGQLKQVIHNITLNAVQAMPEGGLIKIEAGNCALAAGSGLPLPEGAYVKLVFSDTGTGIPERYTAKIFEPYFTTKTKGHGLGLSTVYSIIKNHGGHISVASAMGVGTTFSIYLPAAEKARCEPAIRSGEIFKGSGRVLVMDDDETVRKAAARLLTALGYECLCASDGVEAVKEYGNALRDGKPFAVVITDLTVPGGMGGKETARSIKALDPSARIIVSSGYSDDPVMAEYAQNGFDAVLAKPYDISSLATALSGLLRK